MGKLFVGARMEAEFEDRALAHLNTVIGAKLRRGESMMFTWTNPPASGEGRTAIWLHPLSDIVFKYYGHRRPSLNPAWIEVLMLEANKPAGLTLIPEPDAEQQLVSQPPQHRVAPEHR